MPRLVWTLPDGETTARWATDEGGSSEATQGGVYLLEALAVAAPFTVHFTWSFLYGDAQLDLSDPQHPLPLTSGIYSFALQGIVPVGFTVGKVLVYGFDIDTDNNDAGYSFGGEVVELSPAVPVSTGASITFFTEANSSFLASITHNDTDARDCQAKAYIQKVA